MPRWQDEEIEELGPTLGHNVRNGQNIAHYIRARLGRLKGYR